MAGINAPVSQALRWCGWEVDSFDWSINPSHDLRDQEVQRHVQALVVKADAVMVAMDCSTYSRARERPIPGHPNAPQPLRSAEHVLGLPGLSSKDLAKVRDANNITKFLAGLPDAAGQAAFVFENPELAWLWQDPRIRRLPWRRQVQAPEAFDTSAGAGQAPVRVSPHPRAR